MFDYSQILKRTYLFTYICQHNTAPTQTKHLNIVLAGTKDLAERGFDPRTSGLWAQHASTAPLCFPQLQLITFDE